MCKLGVVFQERLKIEVKIIISFLLALTANRKSYITRRLAQQRMTLSDLKYLKSTSSASRAISAVAKLLVLQHFSRRRSKCRSAEVEKADEGARKSDVDVPLLDIVQSGQLPLQLTRVYD